MVAPAARPEQRDQALPRPRWRTQPQCRRVAARQGCWAAQSCPIPSLGTKPTSPLCRTPAGGASDCAGRCRNRPALPRLCVPCMPALQGSSKAITQMQVHLVRVRVSVDTVMRCVGMRGSRLAPSAHSAARAAAAAAAATAELAAATLRRKTSGRPPRSSRRPAGRTWACTHRPQGSAGLQAGWPPSNGRQHHRRSLARPDQRLPAPATPGRRQRRAQSLQSPIGITNHFWEVAGRFCGQPLAAAAITIRARAAPPCRRA